MPQSTDRILTTHAGSLPMPADLHAMLRAKEAGQPYDAPALQTRLTRAVAEVVQQQAEHGLDIISDGEQSKTSFTTYVSERLAGIESRPGAVARAVSDRQRQDFPEYFAAQQAAAPGVGRRQFYCVGPLQDIGQEAMQTDIANLQCGFCTPGMLMTGYALLQHNPAPTEEEIRWAISGNLCRCTGYVNIVKAVQYAAAKIQQGET